MCGEAKPHRGPEGLGHSFVEEPSRLPAPHSLGREERGRGPSAFGSWRVLFCLHTGKGGPRADPSPQEVRCAGEGQSKDGRPELSMEGHRSPGRNVRSR